MFIGHFGLAFGAKNAAPTVSLAGTVLGDYVCAIADDDFNSPALSAGVIGSHSATLLDSGDGAGSFAAYATEDGTSSGGTMPCRRMVPVW